LLNRLIRMHYLEIKELAAKFRKNPTVAEKKLWKFLRDRNYREGGFRNAELSDMDSVLLKLNNVFAEPRFPLQLQVGELSSCMVT